MTDDDFTELSHHLEALCFWTEAGLAAISTPWRFEPREFITVFRRCGWISSRELSRVSIEAPSQGRGRAEQLRGELNKMTRKYLVTSYLRASHFFTQVVHETMWWQFREEIANERYFRTMYEINSINEAKEDYRSGFAKRLNRIKKYETESSYGTRRPTAAKEKARSLNNGQANADLGGESGDGPIFRGRGFLQITGRKIIQTTGITEVRFYNRLESDNDSCG